MDDLITPHDFVEDCDCHQCALSARGLLRTEVTRLRNIEAAAVMCIEHPVWNDDQFYDLMRGLEDSLRGEVGADKTVAQDKDAERYRQIRRGQHWSVIDGIGDTLRGDDLDVAIDATLKTPNVELTGAAPTDRKRSHRRLRNDKRKDDR